MHIVSFTSLAVLISGLLLGLVLLGEVRPARSEPVVKQWLVTPTARINTDRVSALYSCGEPARFTITVTSAGKLAEQGICTVKLTLDGGKVLSEERYDLAVAKPFVITASLEEPGFIRCDFMGADNAPHPLRARAAAGFAVEKITQGEPEPADFDAYWAALLQRQAEIPDAVTSERLPDTIGKPGFAYYKISVRTIDDGRIYGFLGIPADRPGPFPALVILSGAGSGYTTPDGTFIRPDMMTLAMNVHGIDPTLPEEDYAQRYKALTTETPYWLQGAESHESYYFRNAILGVNAAVEYVRAHAQWNGQQLQYLGASQGGGFGLMLGGLNPHITAIAASVPALCDHGGIRVGRSAGWPQLVSSLPAEKQQAALAMSGYYDAVNFAKRVRCPVIFTVGYNDATCPPSSVYAAFNALKCTKYIMTAPLEDHPVPWEHINGIWQWIQHPLDEQYRQYRAYFKY